MPIGRSDAANVGVVAFGVSRAEDNNGKLQAFARLQNFGPAEAEVLLKLFVNDQVRRDQRRPAEHPAGRDPRAGLPAGRLRFGRFARPGGNGRPTGRGRRGVDRRQPAPPGPGPADYAQERASGTGPGHQGGQRNGRGPRGKPRIPRVQDLPGPGRAGRVGPRDLRSGPPSQNAADEHVFHRLPPARRAVGRPSPRSPCRKSSMPPCRTA